MRGDVYRLKSDRGALGNEQKGVRYGVVVQSDDLYLSTTLIAPTSTSASARDYRPEVNILDRPTRVMIDQVAACAPTRLGEHVGILTLRELQDVDLALLAVLGLDR